MDWVGDFDLVFYGYGPCIGDSCWGVDYDFGFGDHPDRWEVGCGGNEVEMQRIGYFWDYFGGFQESCKEKRDAFSVS